MTPADTPETVLQEKHEAAIVKLVSDVRCGKLEGSERLALATVDLLEQIITNSENDSAVALLSTLRAVCLTLSNALPRALEASSITRRLIKALRDEHTHAQNLGAGCSLQRLVLAGGGAAARRGTVGQGGGALLREHIDELRVEIESSPSQIAQETARLTAGCQLVLAVGHSTLTQKALANKGTSVLMIESDPMALRVSGGCDVTVTSVAAAAALLPRVNKVVIEAVAILGDGAVLAASGARAITAAAKFYSVPVVVLSPLHRVCGLHACALPRLTAPHAPSGGLSQGTTVAPALDHIPPEHITLFITNLGGSSPSYMYRLLSEIYDPQDYQI